MRVNEALARINERSAEDHVGRTFQEVVPQLADDLVAIARGVLETGEPVIGLEIAAGTPKSPDVLRHWSASYYPVLGPDGEPIGVGAVVEETTERRHAEQRERAARADAEAAAATLRKLERVSQAALEHLSLQDLLDALLGRIVEVLEADTAAILLVEADGKLHVRATAGGLGGDSTLGIPIGEGMAGRVAASRAPLLVPDLSKIELYRSTLRDRGINSIVAIPLVVEDRVIGVVHAGSEAYAQFVEDDARLLELIADRIALAINQASLYEAEHAAQQRLRFLGEAGALLGSSLDVEKTLEQLGGSSPAGSPTGAASTSSPRRPACDSSRWRTATWREPAAFARRCPSRRPRLGSAASSEAAAGERRRSARRAAERPRPDVRRHEPRLGQRRPDADDEDEVEFALDIARRAAIAIDNAQLYGAAAERAQAARVLASVGDGVFFVDRAGVIRTWNRAAAIATACPRRQSSTGSQSRRSRAGRRSRRGSRSRPRAAPRRGPSRCRSISASASSGSRSTASPSRTVSSMRSATSRRSVRSSGCGPSSSRPCRTSCARRSPRSTARR